MSLENRVVERTDLSSCRLSQAARSLSHYFQFEYDRLKFEKRLFLEELQKTADPQKIAELQTAIRDNNLEWLALHRGWDNSSLRRRLLCNSNAEQNFTGVEKRITAEPNSNRFESFEPISENRQGKGRFKLQGYAAVFNKDSLDLGGFIERIAPKAFDGILGSCDCRALVNHNSDLILGRTTSKSLRLYEDSIGLKFYCDLPTDDSLSQSVINRVTRRDWSQCSFAFWVEKDRWEMAKKRGDSDIRIIEKIGALLDISLVTFPAYPDTSASILLERSASDIYSDEQFLDDQLAEDLRIDEELAKSERLKNREFQNKYNKAGRIMNRINLQLSS